MQWFQPSDTVALTQVQGHQAHAHQPRLEPAKPRHIGASIVPVYTSVHTLAHGVHASTCKEHEHRLQGVKKWGDLRM